MSCPEPLYVRGCSLKFSPSYQAPSNGGVTLSGGEPLLQFDFSRAILERCRAEGVHTAIESAVNYPWERVAAMLEVTDLVMIDIKHMDSARHREYTGVPNERILENALRLGQQPQPLIVRTPLIPGVNDNEADIAAIAAFARQLPNLVYYELLPFHPMATSKYQSLDMNYRAKDLARNTNERVEALTEVARAAGIEARHG